MDLNFFGKIFRGDKVIWCIFIALCIVSLLEVFSATSTIVYRQGNHWGPILRHAIFLFIGFGLVMFMQRVSSKRYQFLLLGMPISVILLLVTMVLGTDVNGAQRWIGVGGLFTIQPSEIAKLSVIAYVAFLLSKMNTANESIMFRFILGGSALICLLIAPENLSTACLLFLVCFLMMFIGQVSFKRLGMLALIGGGALILFVGSLSILPDSFVRDYLPDRIYTWKARFERHSGEDQSTNADGTYNFKITDENFQVSHAKIAIAKGGIIGLPGSSTQRDVLPQAYSDFIYAIILEETGLLGGLFVLLLYVALMVRAGVLASKCEKKFPRYLILGAALILTIQAVINMAVAVNLIPVTGQPLPLISRGGTSTILTCAYFGIILACSAKQNYEEHEDVDESLANVDFGIAEGE